MERNIDDIVSTLKAGKEANRRCSLLIGAGCSVKAGIPLANSFVDYIKQNHHAAYNRATEKSYPHCMAELPSGVRRDLIGKYVDQAKINWAHIAIAQLIKSGYVDRVLTPNFDPLVMRACALVGEFPAVYDFATSQQFKSAYLPEKAIFHLHGQRAGFSLLHTKQEVDSLSGALAPFLKMPERVEHGLLLDTAEITIRFLSTWSKCLSLIMGFTGLLIVITSPPHMFKIGS